MHPSFPRWLIAAALSASLFSGWGTTELRAAGSAAGTPLPIVEEVEPQPLVAQIRRLVEATDLLGIPFRPPTGRRSSRRISSPMPRG